MRLAIFALTLLPVAAQAQSTTLTTPLAPAAQAQTCPVGTSWNAASGSCAAMTEAGSVMDGLKGRSGCSHGAAREVTS